MHGDEKYKKLQEAGLFIGYVPYSRHTVEVQQAMDDAYELLTKSSTPPPSEGAMAENHAAISPEPSFLDRLKAKFGGNK